MSEFVRLVLEFVKMMDIGGLVRERELQLSRSAIRKIIIVMEKLMKVV